MKNHFNVLADDMILYVVEFLPNTSKLNFLSTCTDLNILKNSEPFYKKLSVRGKDNIHLFKQHKHMLTHIKLKDVFIPINIPFVENMNFNNCGKVLLENLNTKVPTKTLVYNNYTGANINVNWEMLPHLETLIMVVGQLDNDNFSTLKNLVYVFIKTNRGEYRKNKKDNNVVFISYEDPVIIDNQPEFNVITILNTTRSFMI